MKTTLQHRQNKVGLHIIIDFLLLTKDGVVRFREKNVKSNIIKCKTDIFVIDSELLRSETVNLGQFRQFKSVSNSQS